MNLIHESHQLHFFTNNSDVTPIPVIISSLLDKLGRYNLVPTFGHEVNASTGIKRQFIVMVASDESLRVEFLSGEIVIYGERKSQPEFIKEALTILEDLHPIFPGKIANRLSVLNTKIYQGNDEEYKELYEKLFTHKKGIPFEWDNRIVERIKLDNGEDINSISAIRRCEVRSHFFNNTQPTDTIMVDIDSNTIAQNDQFRFNLGQAKEVYISLANNNDTLTESLDRYFK